MASTGEEIRPTSSAGVPKGYHRPKKTGSMASSVFSWRSQSKKDAPSEPHIVVYDPLERKLWIDTHRNLKSMLVVITT